MKSSVELNMNSISIYLMMAVYILAGLNHFRVPQFYVPMIPPWFPKPNWMVWLSGVAELTLGILLFWPETRPYAAWTIILMLMVFFTAHFHMYSERNGKFKKVPTFILIARIPFQFLLIYWAFTMT